MDEQFLHKKLYARREQNAFRTLRFARDKVDFCSNDYLGIVKNNLLRLDFNDLAHGSTGSRLLSGNYPLIEETEKLIAEFHNAEAGLIFNSGYDANVGLLSCVPQRDDIIFYDQLIHASIRDGMRLTFAESLSFLHNDLDDLAGKLKNISISSGKNIFVVTESVFSMDGDVAPLKELTDLCEQYNAKLIVDEAHATGIIGEHGEGLVQHLTLQQRCFARVHTFGKACGAHGAIVLGSNELRNYLINFSRPFIYSTALPEISVVAIKESYKIFPDLKNERKHLDELILRMQHSPKVTKDSLSKSMPTKLKPQHSNTPIQVVLIPGNNEVKKVASQLQENNLDVRAILYPSVPKRGERLRIVLHSFNTFEEVDNLLQVLNR